MWLCCLPLCCLLLTCCPITRLEEVCNPKLYIPLGILGGSLGSPPGLSPFMHKMKYLTPMRASRGPCSSFKLLPIFHEGSKTFVVRGDILPAR
jgi:hypothetical protein